MIHKVLCSCYWWHCYYSALQKLWGTILCGWFLPNPYNIRCLWFLDWRIHGFFFQVYQRNVPGTHISITRTRYLPSHHRRHGTDKRCAGLCNDIRTFFPEAVIKGAAIACSEMVRTICSSSFYTYITVDLKSKHVDLNNLFFFDPQSMRIAFISASLCCSTSCQWSYLVYSCVEGWDNVELAIKYCSVIWHTSCAHSVNGHWPPLSICLVSNAIGAGGIQYVETLINKYCLIRLCYAGNAITATFPQAMLSIYIEADGRNQFICLRYLPCW